MKDFAETIIAAPDVVPAKPPALKRIEPIQFPEDALRRQRQRAEERAQSALRSHERRKAVVEAAHQAGYHEGFTKGHDSWLRAYAWGAATGGLVTSAALLWHFLPAL
jgi:hypothetical protein